MINNFFVSQSSSVFLLSPSWKFFLQVQNLPPKILEYFYLPSKKIVGSTNLRGSDKCKNLLDKFLRKSNTIKLCSIFFGWHVVDKIFLPGLFFLEILIFGEKSEILVRATRCS